MEYPKTDRLLEISAGRRIGGFSSTYDDPLLARWAWVRTACCWVHESVCHHNLRQASADPDVPTGCGPSCVAIERHTHTDSAAVLSTTLSWRCPQTAAMGAGMQA